MVINSEQPLIHERSVDHTHGRHLTNGADSRSSLAGPSSYSTPGQGSSAAHSAGLSTPLVSNGPTPPKHSSPAHLAHIDPLQRPISPPPTSTSPSLSRPDSNEVDTSSVRRSALPGPGAERGFRTVYDPFLNKRLRNKKGDSKEVLEQNKQNDAARRKGPTLKSFTHEVSLPQARAHDR